ncbi:MAG: hypothetical protein PGN37_26905 [Mycobacterium kyogaense]|uniref:hypothetical protein n=1 Tax=Mycobacterium kyogaense TaxID=2212479 RepID=UPI002FF9FA17
MAVGAGLTAGIDAIHTQTPRPAAAAHHAAPAPQAPVASPLLAAYVQSSEPSGPAFTAAAPAAPTLFSEADAQAFLRLTTPSSRVRILPTTTPSSTQVTATSGVVRHHRSDRTATFVAAATPERPGRAAADGRAGRLADRQRHRRCRR